MDRIFAQKKSLVILGIFCLALIFLGAFFLRPRAESLVCFNSACFDCKVAKTFTEQERGLMYQEKLDVGKGMLFVFKKEGVYPFWMKNTLIYLDMIWINKNNRVVFIKENAQPCGVGECPQIDSGANANYVLEINAGEVQKAGIKIGDLVKIPPGL